MKERVNLLYCQSRWKQTKASLCKRQKIDILFVEHTKKRYKQLANDEKRAEIGSSTVKHFKTTYNGKKCCKQNYYAEEACKIDGKVLIRWNNLHCSVILFVQNVLKIKMLIEESRHVNIIQLPDWMVLSSRF